MYTNQHGISRGHSTGLPSARELRDQSCTDDTVRGMLDDIGTALWQIVMIGSSVLGTINVKQLRAIVGPDLRLPDALLFGLRETGQSVDDFLHPAKPAEEDKPHNTTPPAKRPRGAKHPLLGLIKASSRPRLFEKNTRATYPNVFNKRTLDQQESNALVRDLRSIKVPGL